MAQYKIISINKMSAGSRRGLLDMTIALDYTVNQSIYLLGASTLSGSSSTEISGITTESSKYEYAKTDVIEDYYNGARSPLSKEDSKWSLILNED